jgi:hypothetical protein
LGSSQFCKPCKSMHAQNNEDPQELSWLVAPH